MYPRHQVLYVLALCLQLVVGQLPADVCPIGILVIELQPVEIIRQGITFTTTFTETYTIPPGPPTVTVTSTGSVPTPTATTLTPSGTDPVTVITIVPPPSGSGSPSIPPASIPSPSSPAVSIPTPSSPVVSIPSPSSPAVSSPSPSPSTTDPPALSSSPSSSAPASSSSASVCVQPSCQAGIQRARYDNPFGSGNEEFNDRFTADYYKQNTPLDEEVVTSFVDIGDAEGADVSYEYDAFFYSCQGGEFTFQITEADDIALAWTGPLACGDFTKANNQTSASFQGGPGQGVSFTTTLEPEVYFPIRLIFVNSGGPASLEFTITGPDGEVGVENLYPEPCDGSNAFVPFGTEGSSGQSCTNS